MTGRSGISAQGLLPILLAGSLVLGSVAAALPSSHSPFLPDEIAVRSLAVCEPTSREIAEMHPAQGAVSFASSNGSTLRLAMSSSADPYTERYEAQVTGPGQAPSPVVQVPFVATVAFLLPTAAICDDLNDDGVTDFITDHSRHGNGFGASFFDRLVVLSSPNGYRFWHLETLDPSTEDYLTLGANEDLVMVTTSFANSGGAKPHSYYVYDLWRFAGGNVVPANQRDPGFPKWVLMTLADNHAAATALTEDEKRQMLEPRQAVEMHGDDLR